MAASLLLLFAACSKNAQSTKTSSSTTTSSKVISSAEAISLSVTDSTGSSDTLYAVKCYPQGGKPDSIAFSSLPISVGTYLTANYSGYTFLKAFKTITPSNTVDGYVVVILYNKKPVALKFSATGTFETVLEQMDIHDMQSGKPWHPGGPFGNRGGGKPDTVAVSALPSAISQYFKTNYPADTLVHAVINPDSSYTVISKDDGLFATTFSSSSKFIARLQLLPPAPQKPVTATDLPESIATYLTATYPGYVFNNAFEILKGSTIENYVVFINANNTSYALLFDGSGTFVKSNTLH